MSRNFLWAWQSARAFVWVATEASARFVRRDCDGEIDRANPVKLPHAEKMTCFEDELLVCCARVSSTPEVSGRLDELLRGPIDWQTVLDRSWWHRIRPLTYLHLSQRPPGTVPVAVLEALSGQVRELRERNERLLSTLRLVSELFESASVPMLVFKGPTLAMDAYGDLSLRECGDLDMLIRREDFPRIKEVLVSTGFDCVWDQFDRERKRQLFACEFQRDGVELDVHWDLAPSWLNYEIDFNDWWANGDPIDAQNHHVRKLCAEDAMEVLCMHGTRHWWDRLRWICDIAELVNCGRITDWDRVEAVAAKSRSYRTVWLGLCLAQDVLGAKLPQDIRESLDQLPVVKRLAGQVQVWLRSGEHAAEVRRLPDRFLFRMRLCDRFRDRLPQLAQYLVTKPSRSLNWNP